MNNSFRRSHLSPFTKVGLLVVLLLSLLTAVSPPPTEAGACNDSDCAQGICWGGTAYSHCVQRHRSDGTPYCHDSTCFTEPILE